MKEYALTKEAATLLRSLYREYKKERKNGTPRSEAILFGGSEHIQNTILQDWLVEDVNDACYELAEAGLVDVLPGDNVALMVSLKAEAIVYMQNRIKRSLGPVASAAKEALDLLP